MPSAWRSALGARRSVLAKELLAEVGVFCTVGCGLGIWGGCALTTMLGGQYAGHALADLRFRAVAILLGIGVGIACALLASIPLLYKIATLQADALLRGD